MLLSQSLLGSLRGMRRATSPAGRAVAFGLLSALGALLFSPGAPAQSSERRGTLIEEIVARVNNQIITLSDYQKALKELRQQIQQDCQGCTPDKIEQQYQDQQKDVLRDMIDQDLLVDFAKDRDINVDTDVVKQLDNIRRQNGFSTLDDLRKAVESQGMDWDDFQQQIRARLLRQRVIEGAVLGRFDITPGEIQQYYDAHKQEYVLPEEVDLAEIFFSTQDKSAEEAEMIRAKAEDIHNRLVRGEDFGELAKRYSEAQTAANNPPGELGIFKRGDLAPQIESVVFKMDKGQFTDVIEVGSPPGFEIFKVMNRAQAGQQPLTAVQDDIRDKLMMQKAEPATRKFLAELREQNYVVVKPGYTDTAAVQASSVIQEVPATPDTPEKKHHKKIGLPKVSGQ